MDEHITNAGTPFEHVSPSIEKEEWSKLFELSVDLLSVITFDGYFKTLNPAWEYTLGFERAELYSTPLMNFVHPADQAKTMDAFKRLARENNVLNFENRYVCKDGSYKWFMWNAIRNEDLIYCVARDVTQHKEMERALRESEKKFCLISENTSDLIGVLDVTGVIQYASLSHKMMVGFPSELYEGNIAFDFIHPEDCPIVKNVFEEMILTKSPQRIRFRCKHAAKCWIVVECNGMPVINEDGQVTSVVVVARDITERHEAEEALQESERQLRTLINALPDCIFFKDGQGRWLEVNEPALRLFELENISYKGKKDSELSNHSIYGRDTLLKCEETDEKAWKARKTIRVDETLPQPNGTSVVFDTIKVPVFHQDGRRKGLVVIGRDITERKKTEELLRKTDKLAVVGELAAGVAHEIRNPLTALKGFAQLLKSQNEDNGGYYEIMLSELERINSIVGEFLLLAKPQVTNFERKCVISLLQDVVALLQSEANKRNVQLLPHFTDDIPLINCEENQLKQVFINILKNAIEATPSGGKVEVTVRCKEGANKVVIEFADEGCGISEERLARLGEPFYTTKEKGTGLGLTVSYRIIENHEGTIDIQSQANKGTKVNIMLPI